MLNDNLRDSQIKDLMNRVRSLETRSPMRSASVTDGNTNFIGNESLTVTGSQKVTGTLNVSGIENVSGSLGVTGNTTLAGPLVVNGTATITGPSTTVTGPLHVKGDQDNTGKLAVKGAATLENDLTVAGSGKILVGSMTISTQASGYGQLLSPTNIYLNAPFVVASGVFTALGNVNVSGALANPGIALKAGAVNNVHIDANGRLWRTA